MGDLITSRPPPAFGWWVRPPGLYHLSIKSIKVMANLLNNQNSTLKDQRSLGSYKAELAAEEIYLKPLQRKNGAGQMEPVLNSKGHQVVIFLMVKNKDQVISTGIVADATAQEGVNPAKAQVARSEYMDKNGQPTSCMVLFNGVNQLEGATKLEL